MVTISKYNDKLYHVHGDNPSNGSIPVRYGMINKKESGYFYFSPSYGGKPMCCRVLREITYKLSELNKEIDL